MTMVMTAKTYTASKLKAELLGVLDEVAESGEEVTVTKHGRPVARLVPVDEPRKSLRGSVTYLVDDEALIAPIDVEWHAETQ